MICDDIRQKLQPFLDDLLVEDEYKAFCEHIDDCHPCNAYVRSVGAMPNQLWRLGQVKVPQDMISTVQYALAHPKEKARTPGNIVQSSLKWLKTIAARLGIKKNAHTVEEEAGQKKP